MDCTCIFICELTEYFISAKMFVFKKRKVKSFWWALWMVGLHFKWDVHVCFYSFWAFFSLKHILYFQLWAVGKSTNMWNLFISSRPLVVCSCGCSDPPVFLILTGKWNFPSEGLSLLHEPSLLLPCPGRGLCCRGSSTLSKMPFPSPKHPLPCFHLGIIHLVFLVSLN